MIYVGLKGLGNDALSNDMRFTSFGSLGPELITIKDIIVLPSFLHNFSQNKQK